MTVKTRTTLSERQRHLRFAASVHVVIIAVLFMTIVGTPATAGGRGASSYRLVFTRQPANAQVEESISSSAYNPSGPSVQVTVRDQSNHLVTSFVGTITLSLQSDPGNGTLSGALVQTVENGTAEFPGIEIDESGFGYRLHAEPCQGFGCFSTLRGAIPVTPADSRKFDIVDVVMTCDPEPCGSGDVTDGNTTASMMTSSGADGDRLFFSVSPGALNCAQYRETSSLVTFSVTGSRTKTITITVPRTTARPLSSYQVCYDSPNKFKDRNGQLVNKGLLPDCTTSDPAPCVVSREFEGNDVDIVFSAPLGDPKGRV